MGAAIGAALFAAVVFGIAVALRRTFGFGVNAAAGLALLTAVALGFGGLLLAIKLDF